MVVKKVALFFSAPLRVPANMMIKKEGVTFSKILIMIGIVGTLIACALVTNYGLKKGNVTAHRWIAYGGFAALYLVSALIFRVIETRKEAVVEKKTSEEIVVRSEEKERLLSMINQEKLYIDVDLYQPIVEASLSMEEKQELFQKIFQRVGNWYQLMIVAAGYIRDYAGLKEMEDSANITRNDVNRQAALSCLAYLVSQHQSLPPTEESTNRVMGFIDSFFRGGAMYTYRYRKAKDHEMLSEMFTLFQPLVSYPLKIEPTDKELEQIEERDALFSAREELLQKRKELAELESSFV